MRLCSMLRICCSDEDVTDKSAYSIGVDVADEYKDLIPSSALYVFQPWKTLVNLLQCSSGDGTNVERRLCA